MKQNSALVWLTLIIIACSFIAAGYGLFAPSAGSIISFTTARGEVVEIWGQGLYKYDTPVAATGFSAADGVTLVLAIPTLVISLVGYRRGSLKDGLLLTGALVYFFYNYTSMGFGAAYNNFFLVYILIFSASLFGLVLALRSFDLELLSSCFGVDLPRQGISTFLMVSGIILGLIWLALSIIPALIAGQAPPEAAYYTTFTTGIIDIGLVSPTLILAAVLIRRNAPFGYLLASTMLIFTSILGASLTLAGILQVIKEVITLGQALAFTVPFVILSLVAVWFTILLFRNFSERAYK
jgi:hypothetical protein